MDIYSPIGTKVKYITPNKLAAKWSSNDCPETHLVLNNVYEIKDIWVGHSSTKVALVGFPGLEFNSVHFANLE